MIKKIKTDQLKPGMFVHDFNCGWIQHPFLRSKMKIKNEKMVAKILKDGIREIYIDTDKGHDVADGSTEEEINRDIKRALNKVAEPSIEGGDPVSNTVEEHGNAGKAPGAGNAQAEYRPRRNALSETGGVMAPGERYEDTVSVHEEIIKARKIKEEAVRTVKSLMEDIRIGKQIEMEKVDHVVGGMVDSILRNKDALLSLSRIKKVDDYTFVHSVSVGALIISFAKHLGFDYQLMKDAGVGGLLHDIGKTMVPADILTKKDGLTDDEFAEIKKHVEYSRSILYGTDGIAESSILVAAHHHERLDGSGYPEGLGRGRISEIGQMAAIVDVYDAMTSKRCYQRKFQPTEVLKKLFEWDYFYNREMVQQFIRFIGIYPVGSLVRLESGMLGVVLDHDGRNLLYPVVRIIYDTKKEKLLLPYDIDLSESAGSAGEDKVTCSESPNKWSIIPETYL